MFTIENKLVHEFANRLHKQNKKGKRKYGRSLDDCSFNDYDWESMLIEELIDGLQYQQKYIMELKGEISKLRGK